MTKGERSRERSASPRATGRGESAAGRPPHAPTRDETLVPVGEFGRAHGLKGEVRLKSYTGDPRAIADYGPLVAEDGRCFRLRAVRPAPGGAPDMFIAQVEAVTTRGGAEALNRVTLSVAREKLPLPDEDEFLLADLIGLAVQNESGAVIGTVVDVPNYGGGDLLDIVPTQGGATGLLPFTKAFVPIVDIAARRIVAAVPEDFFAPAKPVPEADEAGAEP